MTSPAIYDDHDAMEKASSINQKYLDALDSGDHGRKKISQMHEDQLANYLRETSVFDQILTPREITAQ